MRNRLNRLRRYRTELAALKVRLEDLENVAPRVSSYELVRASGGAVGLDALLVVREELASEYDTLLAAYLSEYAKISVCLREHLQGLELSVLEHFYLHGRSWPEVSARLHISQSWCFNLHRRALEKVVKCSAQG